MYEDITIDKPEALSRRTFLTGAGIAVAGGVIAATMTDTAHAAEAAPVAAEATERIFDGQQLAIGRVVHNSDVCSGCRTCEAVCTLYHEGVAGSTLSRLKWDKDVMDACITDIYTCKQCAGAECMAVCPTGALHVTVTTTFAASTGRPAFPRSPNSSVSACLTSPRNSSPSTASCCLRN